MPVTPMYVCSTAHITESDAELLGRFSDPDVEILDASFETPVVYPHSVYGWLVWIPGADMYVNTYAEWFAGNGLSPSFMKVCEHARSVGCQYILFDCDETADDEHGALDTHDW